MFQPRVKLEFIRRYCSPAEGWTVFVDIDPSEEGRTGGERTTQEAKNRQQQMQKDAKGAREELENLRVTVGGDRAAWYEKNQLPHIDGDRDIVAFHAKQSCYLIAEVEGESSGQPEQKVYKAIGQLVIAASADIQSGWKRHLVLVVCGKQLSQCAERAKALEELNIAVVAITENKNDDSWPLGKTLPFSEDTGRR